MGRPAPSSSPSFFFVSRAHPGALPAACALALGLLVASAAEAADRIGSHWEAAQIVAQHPGTSEVVVATYEVATTGSEPRSLVLGIADDYAYFEEGGVRMILDARLGRIISLDLASGSFSHDSIYWLAGFLEYETRNRMWIREILQRVGKTGSNFYAQIDPFWIESEFGVAIEDSPRPHIETTEIEAGLSFSYGGDRIAAVTFAQQQLAGARRDRLRNILRVATRLHPEILEQVVAAGRLPETLEVRLVRMPPYQDTAMTIFRLQSARSESMAFPLPSEARRNRVGDHPFNADVLPVLEAAVQGTWQSGPKSRGAYFSEIRAAVNRKGWFEAWLLHLELGLLTADSAAGCTDDLAAAGSCVPTTVYWADLKQDPRGRLYFEAAEIQDTEPARAVELWRSISVDDLPNAYLMGTFIGNVVSVHRNAFETAPVDPYTMFTTALLANPYVSSFYKDLGDHFRRELEFSLAWTCYDLGRALPNRPTGDVLEHVDQIESGLRQRVPQLF